MQRLEDAQPLDDAALERALGRLRETIKQRGLRNSSVREAIAKAALTQPGHFSVDDLVRVLRGGGNADAHPATVYRVIPLLVESGLIQLALYSGAESARYERAFEREHHDHLICTRCGKVVEFQFEAIEVLQDNIAERFGFTLTGHIHELVGLCQACSEATQAAEPSENSSSR